MSRVYVAESLSSEVQKLVVLKVLKVELAVDPAMRVAFVREAEISARLNHANIVQVFEVFEQPNTLAIVMQYLDGLPLSEILGRSQEQLPLDLHLHVLTQVLAGLHYFHELKDADEAPLNGVHRDVSPQNVCVLYEGGVKVVDFGIAKIPTPLEEQTRAGIVKGKLRYMSPEQWLGQADIDRRADIYSVGVMLWEAAAKQRMWATRDPRAIARGVVRGELPSLRDAAPGISDDLVAIIERALALDRTARYRTAEELQLDLEDVLESVPGDGYARQLSGFMLAQFDEDRQLRQGALRVALHAPKSEVLAPEVLAPDDDACREPEISEETGPTTLKWIADDKVHVAPWRRTYLAALAAAALVMLGLLFLQLTAVRTEALAHPGLAGARPSPKASALRGRALYADPRGDRAGQGRSGVTSPPDPAATSDSPRPVQDTIEAERELATARGEATELRSAAARREERRRRRSLQPRAPSQEQEAFVSAQRPPAEEPEQLNRCNPPYKLERDGVKTFDPDCF